MAISLAVVTMRNGTERLKLLTPYHPDLPAKAKQLGGRWNGEAKAWYFDPRDAERVRALALDVYGVDPLSDRPPELLTVRVRLSGRFPKSDDPPAVPATDQSLFLFGREIAHRVERDYAVSLGTGVTIVEAGFAGSGGSRANPRLDTREGTIIEVRDVPRPLVEAEMARYPGAVQIVTDAAPAPADDGQVIAQIVGLASTLSPTGRQRLLEALGALPERKVVPASREHRMGALEYQSQDYTSSSGGSQ